MNHAFFKGSAFPRCRSGHPLRAHEDLAKMGGLGKYMKVSMITMLIYLHIHRRYPAPLRVLEQGRGPRRHLRGRRRRSDLHVLWVLGADGLMTAFYMFRMWFMVFKGQPNEGTKHGHRARAPQARGAHRHALPLVSWPPWPSPPVRPVHRDGFFGAIYYEHAHVLSTAERLTEVFTSPLTYISIWLR